MLSNLRLRKVLNKCFQWFVFLKTLELEALISSTTDKVLHPEVRSIYAQQKHYSTQKRKKRKKKEQERKPCVCIIAVIKKELLTKLICLSIFPAILATLIISRGSG